VEERLLLNKFFFQLLICALVIKPDKVDKNASPRTMTNVIVWHFCDYDAMNETSVKTYLQYLCYCYHSRTVNVHPLCTVMHIKAGPPLTCDQAHCLV